jgi:DNA topoisomerase-1
MSKKYFTTKTLVIVESPAKCKKIEEYLGSGYKCVASYGHLRELPSLKNIDIENNFNPTYTVIDNAIKKKQIELLRKEIKNADEVILACDNDREGSAINWHLCQLFKLDINKTKRITFNEVTESALHTAIKNPTTINMNEVHAQQARQVLDILVGFKISPMLWKFISNAKGKTNALSAGRCQTPALRLIYDNDNDIKSCEERKVYNTTGYFTNSNIAFDLSPQGKHESEHEITDFLDGSADFSHIYTCSQPVKVFKKPPEPFTTSRIQQVASNELHYSPKETMRICQLLYEGGFITYMRTDSKTYSAEFLDEVKEYIVHTYDDGEKYISENIESISTGVVKEPEKKNNAKKGKQPSQVTDSLRQVTDSLRQVTDSLRQEAHEAIRCTNISLSELPENIDSTFGSKERRMYKLIWENTLESCMISASFYSVTANISSFQEMKFVYTSELIDFPGWKIVAKKYSIENKEYQYLQTIKQNSLIQYKKICSRITIKGSKQHYTEARLVQLLEEKGIGRPSTFSSLVDKIQERGYVKKEDIKGKENICKDYELENNAICEIETKREFGNEKGKLVLQPLGRVVMEFLEKHFDYLFNYNYTSLMEETLDKISKGDHIWYELCNKCNKEIDILVDGLKDETKIEIKLDENNTYMIGKYGPVIKCVEEVNGKEEVQFKPIKKDVDIKLLEKGSFTVEDIIDTNKTSKSQYILGQHNGKDVILKKGKFGLYISWGENSKNLKELGNRPIDNITFDEVRKYLDEGSNMIREISTSLSIRKGPKGDYIFYKTSRMKKPEFKDIKAFVSETSEDYKICDITILKSWLSEKYNI